ncbi:MAG: group II intron reverse transcriptase/maturase [Acidobacteria bacterium]|nr:group II intron reverse transcriptase/maturase [Acidobacteriota bacterium]
MDKTKPYSISKKVVWEAYLRVKANDGAAGIDDQSIADFERDLKNNLYKIWNRMSSGTYFPPPVRTVSIPKSDGGERKLGIPTVGDRVAQMVVKLYLEPEVEPHFHPDSYGYRPAKSALEAVTTARQRCWRYDWCIDLDIKGFFDNLDHSLIMRAVKKHTNVAWVLLYIERWLKAPIQREEGALEERDRGTPQGSVVSPLLANTFMHHAFDEWMRKEFPHVPFERYADDVLVHCVSEKQAKFVLAAIRKRLALCKLEVHPEKTHIVYCKDADRTGSHEHERFDFLGFTFRPRLSRNKWGKSFVNFSPAISDKAAKAIRQEIRSWKLHLRSDKSLEDLAHMFNGVVQGWINYYGRFYKSAMYPTLRGIEEYLVRWAQRKYKRFQRHGTRARVWLGRIARREPRLFAHWRMGLRSPAG